MTEAELRSARLLFASELARGAVSEADLDRRRVRRAVADRLTPPPAIRAMQRIAMKMGALGYERSCARPLHAARRAVLGDAAYGMPRVLLRVDEFPHYASLDKPGRYDPRAYARFHAILAARGIPYLLAVLSALAVRPLDPWATGGRAINEDEAAMLHSVADDGVTLALHGLQHRTRDARPSRHSELAGLSQNELRELLVAAEAILGEHAIERPPVFVAPFNRFATSQYSVLAERYAVVCGGPETVRRLGFTRTPIWRGEAVYAPAYPPLYGTAGEVTRALRSLMRQRCNLWVPVVLHWGWEVDRGLDEMSALADLLVGCAVGWDAFLDAVEASR